MVLHNDKLRDSCKLSSRVYYVDCHYDSERWLRGAQHETLLAMARSTRIFVRGIL
jgi:hypothetical protein